MSPTLQRDPILKAVVEVCRDSDANYVGIFGSYARGEATRTSDIDLYVRFKKSKSLLDLGGLQTELAQVAGRPVDILTQLPSNPYIKPQVERDLLPLYEE
ncbi:MAG: nucleotidyltransferase family protein [Patescibacteria group bacterium]